MRQNSDYLIELDQQVGDGDLGITARKIADTLDGYIAQQQDESDLGKYIMEGYEDQQRGTIDYRFINRHRAHAGAQAKGAADLSLTQILKCSKRQYKASTKR